jgi:flagellar basal-body rod modification protein FlgD
MIEATTAIPGSEPATPAATGLGQLGTDAFLKLLVAQLKYQNPMAPSDGTAMLQQTAQFTTVETLKQIAEANQRLMGFQQVTMALTIVGKGVTAISLDGSYVSGEVEGIRFTADGPFLRLDTGIEIPITNVLSVSAPDEAAPSPSPSPPPPPPADAPPPEDPGTAEEAGTGAVTPSHTGWDPVPQPDGPRMGTTP